MDTQDMSGAVQSAWILWLMILFIGILFWAFRPKNRRRFEDDGKIPFKEDGNGA